jgi:N-carbamoyl-L-amino-acid hydrolase
MPAINPVRLIADLRRFAEFGAYKSGVHRPTYTAADMESRQWLAERYTEIGLDASIDGVGNVFGFSRTATPTLLIGSHAESQNQAGWLDGALGVIYGLEIARSFAEHPECRGLGIDTVAWADEESHFISLLGSRSFVGSIDEANLDAGRNNYHGQPLREALAEAGLAGRARRLIDPSRHVGYLEAHIEQGDFLEATGNRLGVVTSIVAIWQYRITFTGVQNHAGTTRMAIRKDAGAAAVHFAAAVAAQFPRQAGERSVWTVGRISLDPGAANIVPGKAELLFQFRDENVATLERLEQLMQALAAETAANFGCPVAIEVIDKGTPSRMEDRFQAALEAAAKRHAPGTYVRMPSGASHDAQIVARKLPAGMLFVPSIGGISHHWTEDTEEADILLGCQVMADAAESILRGD